MLHWGVHPLLTVHGNATQESVTFGVEPTRRGVREKTVPVTCGINQNSIQHVSLAIGEVRSFRLTGVGTLDSDIYILTYFYTGIDTVCSYYKTRDSN